MNRRVRIILGLTILAVSVALLIWGFKPLDRKILIHPISPSDMELPTPVSLLLQPEVGS